MIKLLITGGCGFLGSNLASHGIVNGYDVTIFDNLSREGSVENLKWLRNLGEFNFFHGDIRNKNDIESLVKEFQPDTVFHLAGQVAMTTSIENPYKDFEINVKGTINLLDSIRKYSSHSYVLYSSTNKVYGDLEQFTYNETKTRYICNDFPNGFSEETALDFQSPYGCSKGSADQYLLDYHRFFDLKTTVFRHSSMYGSRQYATADQGWIGWFCQKAIEKSKNINSSPFTISGNGKQVRDILHADDMINLYFSALENNSALIGNAYNIGGSFDQSLSLLELFSILEELTNTKLDYTMLPVRQSDQKVFVADISKIYKDLNWKPHVSSKSGIENMITWIRETNI